LFTPSLRNGFVDWDDRVMLLENPRYRGVDASTLRWMTFTVLTEHYEPVTWFSFADDYLL
jgi:hypothetical protein